MEENNMIINMATITNIQLLSEKIGRKPIPFKLLENKSNSELCRIRDELIIEYSDKIKQENRISYPNYIVNFDDLADKFWSHTYLVSVTSQGITFLVNADHEQDALDYVMDHIVEKELTGLYSEYPYDENGEDITAGNCSYPFTTHSIHIQEL